ncbi:MAG: ABC transporter permease [Bacillota bacterium]
MIFHIALKDLKIIFKDKKALAIMLVMPAVIMLILGSALGPIFEGNNAIKRFPIAVVNKDTGIMSQIYINQVLRDGAKEIFNTYVVHEEKAQQMLKDKIVPSVIIIPEDYTKKLLDNSPVTIEVKSNVDQKQKGDIVKGVTERFNQQMFLHLTAASAAVDVLRENNIPIKKAVSSMTDIQAVMVDLQQELGEGLIEFYEVDQEENRTVSGMQYYSVAMLVMFILFGAAMGTKLMVEEREIRTLTRVISTRAGKARVITGKFLGLLLISFTQALILIVFTRFVYGVNWGSSIAGILLITVCSAFSGSGLGMMIAAISRSSKAADGIAQIFIQVFTVLGGGMIPIYVLPGFVRTLSKGTINWWAVNGYYDLMLGKDTVSILPGCLVLILMGVFYLSIGTLRFRT